MGIFGIGREENSRSSSDSNEDIVKEVVSEVSSNVPRIEGEVEVPKEGNEIEISDEEKNLVNTFRKVEDPMNRRDFLRLATIFAAGLGVAACTPKQPFKDEELKSTTEAMRQLPTNAMEVGREFLLKDPIRLNPGEFSIGAEGYPTAIVDRSMFAKKENGEPLFIRYSGSQFNEVTYLHHTGEKPPVVGEILPLMYKVPEDVADMEENIVPYAISVQSERAKIKFNDGKNHYLVPIVTTGNSTGIVDIIKDGEVVNGAYKSFEVKPDSVSGLTQGYLSFAVLTEIGNELVMEGVIENNNIFLVNRDNIPEEISALMGE